MLSFFPGAEGALQAGAQEGGEAGASHQVPEGAWQAVPGLSHQCPAEGVQGVPQNCLHSGKQHNSAFFVIMFFKV